MATKKAPRIKHRVKVEVSDGKWIYPSSRYGKDDIHEFTEGGYDDGTVYINLVVPKKKVGQTKTYTVTVEYLGPRQYKQTYEQRVKAMAASEKRREAWQKKQEQEELERQEKEMIQRRKRIMNQIELAFVKQGRDAVNFITCDKCSAMATRLCLAYENPGSQVIDPDQITGAVCEEHGKHAYNAQTVKYFASSMLPYKTKATIACNLLEFFYDGLRQIYVKATVDRA